MKRLLSGFLLSHIICTFVMAQTSDIPTNRDLSATNEIQKKLWFPVGEQLIYKIYWGFIPVGTSITWSEWVVRDNKPFLALRMRTKTNKLFDKIRLVNDIAESIVDPISFKPISYRRRMIRRSSKCDETTLFDYKQMQGSWKAVCSDKSKTFSIQSDTRDILTFMYFMRKHPLSENSESKYKVIADDGLFDLDIKTGTSEKIKLPIFDKVKSLKINPIFNFDGLLVNKGKFAVWISEDTRHICTKVIINGTIANIKVFLCEVLGPGKDSWSRITNEKGKLKECIISENIDAAFK